VTTAPQPGKVRRALGRARTSVNESGRFLVAQPEGHYRLAAVAGVHLDIAAFWRQVASSLRHE
jgi:hypothetical protein